MLNLNVVLNNEKIKEGIKANLLKEDSLVESAITETLKFNNNRVAIDVLVNRELTSFENTLHYDKSKKVYLLESRLFDDSTGAMINAYLEIFDENLNILDDCEDCVWDYADWKVVSSYLLTCENKNTGAIISRYCFGLNLDEAKEDYLRVLKESGHAIEGSFRENFKIIDKEIINK